MNLTQIIMLCTAIAGLWTSESSLAPRALHAQEASRTVTEALELGASSDLSTLAGKAAPAPDDGVPRGEPGPTRDVEITDVISREFTVFAGTDMEPVDAVSREFIATAGPDPYEAQDDISREVAVFSVIPLELGVPYTGELPVGAELRFKVVTEAGLTARIFLDHANSSAWTQVFASFEEFPDDNSEFSSAVPFQPDQEVFVPTTQAGTYYILIRNVHDANPPPSVAFTIVVNALPFGVDRVEPPVVGAGEVTLRLTGGHLDMASTVRLRPSDGGPDIAAVKLNAPDAAHLRARFDLTDVALGTYDLVTQVEGGEEVILPQAVTVEAPNEIHIETTGIPSPLIRSGHSHNTGTTWIIIENTSNIDAPIVTVYIFAPNGPDLVLNVDGDPPIPLGGDDEWVSTALWFESLSPGDRIQLPVKITVGPGFVGPLVQIYPDATAFSRQVFRDGILTGPGGMVENMILALAEPNDPPEVWTEAFPLLEQYVVEKFNEVGLGESGISRVSRRTACSFVCQVLWNDCYVACLGLPSCTTQCDRVRNWCEHCCDDKCATDCPGHWIPNWDCHPRQCPTGGCGGEDTRCPGYCVMHLVHVGDAGKGASRDAICGPVPQCVYPQCTPGGSSTDPNEKNGPAGYMEQRFVAQPGIETYRVYFENDPNAMLPAALVVIDDPLDPTLDSASFRVHEFQFGSTTIQVPPDRSSYQTVVDVRPDVDLLVDIRASVMPDTDVAQFVLQALDPNTMQPPSDPTAGFLPPNDETGRGEGYVEFGVAVRPEIPSGTVVTNQATITFDYNDPMSTNVVFNTIDAGAPTSAIAALPGQIRLHHFAVCWTGADDANGCGVANVTMYVAEDDGAYAPWLTTDQPCTDYRQVRLQHTYKFYSVATDYVGNGELPPTDPNGVIIPDAWTTVTGFRGDANCDGAVNVDDITAFVMALIDSTTYESTFPSCNFLNNDCNDDGAADVDDVNAFVALVGAGYRRGDVNCDGTVDFGDINPFVLILTDPALWQTTFPGCPMLNGDIDGDGNVDLADINPLVALLTGG